MNFLDVLQKNATNLAKKAEDFRVRIDTLQANGHSAAATIKELEKTCAEIGRLNDEIKAELAKQDP